MNIFLRGLTEGRPAFGNTADRTQGRKTFGRTDVVVILG